MTQPQPQVAPQGSGSSGCGCFGCCLGGCLGGFVMALIAAIILPMVLGGILMTLGPKLLLHFGDQFMAAIKERTAKPMVLPAYQPADPNLGNRFVERVTQDLANARNQGGTFKVNASPDELNGVLRGWVKGQPDTPWAKAVHDGMVTIEGGKIRTQLTLLGQGLADAMPARIEPTKPGDQALDLAPVKSAFAQGQFLNFDATSTVTRSGDTTKIKIEKLSVFGFESAPDLELEITGQEAPPGQVEKPENAPIRIPGFKGLGVGPAGVELELDPKKLADWWEKAKAEAAKQDSGGSD